jgi:hypothetical protein
MGSLITNDLRIFNADAFANTAMEQPAYLFIGKDTVWDDEELPDSLVGSDQEKINIYKDVLAVKRIPADSIASVIKRVNWATGIIYDQYDHRINMIDGRKTNGDSYNFFVFTDEFNVYKCISNNNGIASTTKPTSTQVTPFQTTDGYIWKYMYTVKSTDVFNYMTDAWIPIYTLDYNDGSSQWLVQESAIPGGIHNVVVDSAGSGYSSSTPPNVVITGDGTGATAVANVNAGTGAITSIVITDPGIGYTYATVSFTATGGGAGASATAIMSPIGGHGSDARAELGGVSKMLKINISGDEGGDFPLTSFRQAGIIFMPMSTDLGSKLTVDNASGFNVGDTVTGDTTNANGTIRVIESNKKVIWVENVTGSFNQSENIGNGTISTSISLVDNNTNIPLSALTGSSSEIIEDTGKLFYVSNRIAVYRSSSQTESIRFVIGF